MNPDKSSTQPRILAIETSCDETALSYLVGLEAKSHHIHSQASLHAEHGGVIPNLAKREHAKNLVPILSLVFKDIFGNEIQQASGDNNNIDGATISIVETELSRAEGLFNSLLSYIRLISHQDFLKIKDSIDAIAVTYGPGLEPALWVGISFAKALAAIFDKPLFPINHMEGHIASVIAESVESEQKNEISKTKIEFPAVSLLISGGHTELVLATSWHEYTILGHTVDDAVGEAYDKVARILGLPYPGGPEISKLAQLAQSQTDTEKIFALPRPMIHTNDLNFSFSGLKTAVLYAVRDRLKENNATDLTQEEKIALASEFESAVIEVLISKTKKALLENGAHSLIIGGGVIANTAIRKAFETLTTNELDIPLYLPEKNLSTDNATMIGIVAILQYINGKTGLMPATLEFENLKAEGNLKL